MLRREYLYMNEETFSTGCDLLDLVVGGGERHGYPAGRIINLVGDRSSGKTFLACELIAAAFHQWGERFRWVYDDAESGFTFNTERLYGFHIMPVEEEKRTKSRRVEAFSCNFREFLNSLGPKELGVYTLDTLDGLSSKQIHDIAKKRFENFKEGKDMEKGSYQMEAPKFLSQEFFKETTAEAEEKKALLVIISQVRDKIDSMFNEQTRSGGRAMDFYAHTCLWLSTAQKIVRKGRVVGVVVKAYTKKSKTPRPFRSCFFTLLFDYGLDNVGTNVDFLYDLRTEKGELRNSTSLQWSDSAVEKTPKALVEFVRGQGREEEYKVAKKELKLEGVKKISEWIISTDMKAAFEAQFGICMDRNDLIDWIEENHKEAELTQKVRAKWEMIEDSIKTERPPKYPPKEAS